MNAPLSREPSPPRYRPSFGIPVERQDRARSAVLSFVIHALIVAILLFGTARVRTALAPTLTAPGGEGSASVSGAGFPTSSLTIRRVVRILDAQTSQPVQGAEVDYLNSDHPAALTNEKGELTIAFVGSIESFVRVRKSGYGSVTVNVPDAVRDTSAVTIRVRIHE